MNEAAEVKAVVLLLIELLLVGCDQRKPAVSDEDYREFRASYPGMTQQCLDEYHYGGQSSWRPDDPNCFEMQPAQRWSGLWEHGWEWSNFCPAPAKECDWMTKRGTWLTFEKDVHLPRSLPDGIYRVEFVGRRTKVAGNFGHQAAYDHLMVVDRLVSLKLIKARPGP